MGSFRDDLVRAGKRLLETVEERTGREIVEAEELRLLESDRSELRIARQTLRHIGWELLNYQPGDPGAPGGYELRHDVRRFAARQALTAWLEDPLAGQQVDLYVSFVLGRGVPRPQAHDPEVQDHLDKTWDDPANQRILTSFAPLVEKLIDLCLQSNVFFTFFDDGEDGMCRVSLLRFDDVVDAIRHDELASDGKGDRFRILYYKALERRMKYDFGTGQRTAVATQPQSDLTARTVFYEAWGAFDDDDPVMAVQDKGLSRPSDTMLRKGKVYALAVNKTSEMAFGVPRMRRLVSWFGAYNDMLVSFRDRMQAMASVYMKATVRGGQRDLDRLGQMALGRTSAFGAAQEVDSAYPPAPSGPGILGQNESLNFEPFKLDSGAGDVGTAAPVMRAQVTGPWPDSYMSGNANGTIAGDQSLELPTLKFVEREQELWADLFRAFGKASVDAAVRVGDISEWRDPTQREMEQIQAAEEAGEPLPVEVNDEGLVRRDLAFEVSMPSPLKRAMGDIVSAAVQTATAVDPNGENPELSRWLFALILADAFDVEDPMRIVDEVLPRTPAEPEPDPEAERDPVTGEPLEGAIGADGERHTADNPAGVPVKAPQPEERRVQETAFDGVIAAADDALRIVEAASNGNGNGNGSH